MCDVCDEHNALGLQEDEDTDVFPHCYECERKINLYQEQVHVWKIHNREHPLGFRQIFLCQQCNDTRMGRMVE